ncbi:MAG: ABC transporter ATP-binding protein [Christensenellales bacterium]|jgi:multiple sugar transport system ATP-binding protein
MAGLVFRNITKQLECGARMENLNLEIDDGEFVALVGRSGCGKAELIRMAEGYGGQYEGDVYIHEQRVARFRRGFPGASLINEAPLTGTPRREITKLLSRARMPRREINRRIELAAQTLDAAHVLDTRFSQLPPEGRLLAGMVRARAIDAKVVLFHDPFDGMGSRVAARMRLKIKDFHAQTRTIFLMSTHTGNIALSLATRVVALEEGKIRQSDTPQNIYDFPADRFVAEYFGSALINIIPARLERLGGRVQAVFGENRILVPDGKVQKLVSESYIGKTVLMGVRPENLHYEQAFISLSPESAIEAQVRHVELLGSETYLHTSLAGVEGDIIARVDPRCIASPGDEMTLAIDSNRIHFFDETTEESILHRI